MEAPLVAGTLLFESEHLSAHLVARGRLQIRRRGVGMVCNVVAARIVQVGTEADASPGQAWVALTGPVARVDFARKRGNVGLVGPFPVAEVDALADVLRTTLALPRAPRPVPYELLVSDPETYDETLVVSEGPWEFGPDLSRFANAWLYPPPPPDPRAGEAGVRRVRVVGLWRCSGSRDFEGQRDGHGPFGLAAAEIDAFTLEPAR